MSSVELITAEREYLVNLLVGLDEAGWAAATLCEGWDVGDLCAHLIVRERNPIAAPGIVLPPLESLTEDAMAREKTKGPAELIERLRDLPTWARYFPANLNEFWIHNEDVVRGELGRRRPAPEGELADRLWRMASSTSRLNLARLRTPGVIAFEDSVSGHSFARSVGRMIVRGAPATEAAVTVRGGPGEVLLYLSGRREAAQVEIESSDDALAHALATSKLGV